MSAGSTYSERLLLQQIAAGDEAAFRVFFDLHRKRLYLFVKQLIHSRADAEEIIQETFIQVWQSADKLAGIEQPGYYIYRIARNKTLNYMRKMARDESLLRQVLANAQESDDSLSDSLLTKEYQELVNGALDQLSDQKRTIFNLSRVEGLSHEEIAARLGLSKSRVKNIIVETLKFIRAYLQEHSALSALIFWLCSGDLMFA